MIHLRPLAFPFFAVVVAGSHVAASDAIDFNRDIRPILADKCYACHGPDREQRQGGDPDAGGLHFDTRAGAFTDLGGYFAIVPGKPDQSELVRRITSNDPDEAMPPRDHRKQLTDGERQLLIEWVRQGAEWADHWAYEIPHRHTPPPVTAAAWPRNMIDRFVLARLESEGIQPSGRADDTMLLRRISFDLVGLPPASAGLNSNSFHDGPGAYDRTVDRLLSSPQFGEHLAAYWLDLVRYADTVGYHGDQPVSVSPYRDYVINAFNTNMPFDRFTVEQLAGDLLEHATPNQLIASGYNRLGMMSAEGGVQPKEYLAKYASDRVRTASGVWLGSTLGCAECHDHKFDPFTTKDFYRFQAFFADIKERGLYSGAHASGDWGPRLTVPATYLAVLAEPLDREIARVAGIMNTSTPELDRDQRTWEESFSTTANEWSVLMPSEATALHRTKLAIATDGAILASGANPPQNTYRIAGKIPAHTTGFRLEVMPHSSLPAQGPGRAGNGNFVVSEVSVTLPSSESPSAIALTNATATHEQAMGKDGTPYKTWSAAAAIDGDAHGQTWGWAVLPQVGRVNHLVVQFAAEVPTDTEVVIELEQNHTNPKHTLGHFRLWLTGSPGPLKADRSELLPVPVGQSLAVDADNRTVEQQDALSSYYRSIAPRLAETRSRLKSLKEKRDQLDGKYTRTTLITEAVEPRPIRVLPRGNWMDDSGELVEPGVPHFLTQIDGSDRASRADLARWITSPQNPLTARVWVNRLWKRFFGSGLSSVLDDVGAQGQRPSHPELLDTLAVELIESGWDVKHLIRLIVTSETYRQSSLPRDELLERDPYNRFLARQSRFRLDAELVRDNALATSGLLVSRVGGRSVKPYQPVGLYQHLNFPARTYAHDLGEDQYRRGVYTHWQRQFLHPAMKLFDAPPREECTANRPRSNTPLAALVLLNDPSYVEASRVFAERMLGEAPPDRYARIDWLIQRALSRSATPSELAILTPLVEHHLEYYRQHPDDARKLIETGLAPPRAELPPATIAAWTAVARTIFNMHEFITRN